MVTQVATTHRTYKEKIAWAMSTIKERDGYVVIASESEDMDHIVLLNENLYSTYCTCRGARHGLDCYHRIATDRFYDDRRPSFHQQCGITNEPFANYDVVGAALRVFNQTTIDAEIDNAYEVLAPTKQVSQSKMCHGRLWGGDYCFYGAHYLEEVSHAS